MAKGLSVLSTSANRGTTGLQGALHTVAACAHERDPLQVSLQEAG